MAATLMHLRRLVRSRLGIPAMDDFMPDTVVDDHINLAIQAIESEYDWPWSTGAVAEFVSPAAPDLPRPDRWRATRAVFMGQQELTYVSPADLLTWMTTSAEIPKVWCPLGEVIAVRPIAQSATELTHLYYLTPPWLRSDEDVPAMPEVYAGAIVAKAAELLATRESSGGDVTRHGAEFVQWITRMRRDVRNARGTTRVRVRPGGWV